MPNPPAATDLTTNNQLQRPTSPTVTEETPEDEIPTTNNQNNDSTSPTLHLTMELTIDEFPTLSSTTPKTTQHDSQDTLDIRDFSDDSVEPSPAVTSAKPIQTSFKRARDTTSVKTIQTTQHSIVTNVMLLLKFVVNYINATLETWTSSRTLIWTKNRE